MMKTQIKAEIVADSLSPQGERLTSLLITFPRIILAEVNTHRMLSKNTSSSRAIPFKKMVEAVQNNPFIPIAWQKQHSGMQGNEYFTELIDIESKIVEWEYARHSAVDHAKELYQKGVTKQLCNRLLEPFMWTTMLITGSKEGWQNFFELRCPRYTNTAGGVFKSKKDFLKSWYAKNIGRNPSTDLEWLQINKGQAEIHLMDLAEKIYDAMNESNPKQLKAEEWHIPFEDKIQDEEILDYLDEYDYDKSWLELFKVKISTAMAARTSYTVVGDEKEIDYEKMIGLHDRLIEMRHDSPLEHCTRAMDSFEYFDFQKGKLDTVDAYITDMDENTTLLNGTSLTSGWCRNFKGFIQYRHIIENKKI